MVRPLIIGLKEQDEIKKVKETAAKHPVLIRDVIARQVPSRKHVIGLSDFPERKEEWLAQDKLILPVGYRVAYSIEEQPIGMCGHLSISVDTKGNTPNFEAVHMIAQAFGLQPFEIWVEEFEPGWHAINVIGLLEAPRGGQA